MYGLKVTPKGEKRAKYLCSDGTLTSKPGAEAVARFSQIERAEVRQAREEENYPGAKFEPVEVPDWDPGNG